METRVKSALNPCRGCPGRVKEYVGYSILGEAGPGKKRSHDLQPPSVTAGHGCRPSQNAWHAKVEQWIDAAMTDFRVTNSHIS